VIGARVGQEWYDVPKQRSFEVYGNLTEEIYVLDQDKAWLPLPREPDDFDVVVPPHPSDKMFAFLEEDHSQISIPGRNTSSHENMSKYTITSAIVWKFNMSTL
jgi:hypothetical protein